jgi:APA family basic amino acid/polyamine antiporter
MHTSLNLVSSYYVVTPTSSFASVGVTEFVFSGDHKSFQRLSTPITSRLVNIRVRAIMWRRAWGDFLQKAFIRKPQSAFAEEDSREQLHRDLELFDLLCVGVGGTLGSGVFVLTGLIAREHAGPGVIYSWLIAGLCTALSSLSYAELSSRIPSSGSAYAYAYCTLGELPAFCAAWFLTLEYGMSGAAIARSWGDKFSFWLLTSGFSVPGAKEIHNIHELYSINVYAGLMQLVCMIILLAGVRIGKLVVNGFTVLKIALVVFMIIVGLSNFDQHNVEDMTPMGMSGVLRGSSAAFFGLLGYDEVCILAAETKDPLRNLPRAVFGTIFLTTMFSVAASLALVGMQPWPAIDADNGFASAFQSLDMSFAQRVVSTGEVVTLPLVVLVSFLAQPRLQYVMSVDGLLPDVFSRVDSQGNLTMGILISGFILTAVAILVPFSYLDDMISAGVLLSCKPFLDYMDITFATNLVPSILPQLT